MAVDSTKKDETALGLAKDIQSSINRFERVVDNHCRKFVEESNLTIGGLKQDELNAIDELLKTLADSLTRMNALIIFVGREVFDKIE